MTNVRAIALHPLTSTSLVTLMMFVTLWVYVGDISESDLNGPVVTIGLLAVSLFLLLQGSFTRWREWTFLGAGIFVFFLGVWFLFVFILMGELERGDSRPDWLLSASRACLSVGSVASVIGIVERLFIRRGGPAL